MSIPSLIARHFIKFTQQRPQKVIKKIRRTRHRLHVTIYCILCVSQPAILWRCTFSIKIPERGNFSWCYLLLWFYQPFLHTCLSSLQTFARLFFFSSLLLLCGLLFTFFSSVVAKTRWIGSVNNSLLQKINEMNESCC